MINYKKIIKECFGDYNFSVEDIQKITQEDNWAKKKFLFEKILLNSANILIDLEIFERTDLEKLIENFKVPQFNSKFIFRRKNIAEVFFLNKPLLIDELKWVV